MFLVDEVEEVGAELILSDEVGGLAIVAGEAEHGLDVTGLGAGGRDREAACLGTCAAVRESWSTSCRA